MKIQPVTNKNGFGILEVLIASMILIVVVGSAVALGHASLRSSALAAEKTAAYNLAQEGIEQVRNIRDTAWVDQQSDTDWSSGLNVNGVQAGQYKLDKISTGWHLINVAANATDNDFEQLNIGEPAITFTRKVFIEKVNWYTGDNIGIDPVKFPGDPDKVIKKVKVVISWISVTGDRDLTTETYLTDWKSY